MIIVNLLSEVSFIEDNIMTTLYGFSTTPEFLKLITVSHIIVLYGFISEFVSQGSTIMPITISSMNMQVMIFRMKSK